MLGPVPLNCPPVLLRSASPACPCPKGLITSVFLPLVRLVPLQRAPWRSWSLPQPSEAQRGRAGCRSPGGEQQEPRGSAPLRCRGAAGTRGALVGWLRGGEQDMEQPLLKALCTVFSLFCLVKSISSASGTAVVTGCFSCCKEFLLNADASVKVSLMRVSCT